MDTVRHDAPIQGRRHAALCVLGLGLVALTIGMLVARFAFHVPMRGRCFVEPASGRSRRD
jgi:hypothetical protein